LRQIPAIILDAYWRFLEDDGWAIASHVALSALMSLFPFLIFITALAGFFGSRELAEQVERIMFDAWPREAAAPIVGQVQQVMAQSRGELLTAGAMLALWFSSSGIQAVRIALNRAYGVRETRPWWLLRLESIGYVLFGSVALLALATLLVLEPWLEAHFWHDLPVLTPFVGLGSTVRYLVATLVILTTLLTSHAWLPSGARSVGQIAPGILVTLVLILSCGFGFATYLTRFGRNYVATYAGLASAMVALIFLYAVAVIFIYGAELNAAITRTDKK
jgi:membrane protein